MSDPLVHIRLLQREDREEFVALMQRSATLHHPWISPPTTKRGFDAYISRLTREDHAGFALCETQSKKIVGAVNLNNIVLGSFLSASLGYYVGAPYEGRGYMREGLQMVCRHAFEQMGLHRLEANIQPENHRSIALVKACGFSYEGLSPKFLFIDGAWRDHERWCLLHNREAMSHRGRFR